VTAVCAAPDCGGPIDETAICELCGLPAGVPLTAAGEAVRKGKSVRKGEPVREGEAVQEGEEEPTVQLRDAGEVLVVKDVTIPVPVRRQDPRSLVSEDWHVPEQERRCAICDAAVGRTTPGVMARDKGFCGSCGARFNFTPQLKPGDVLGNYEVIGCVGRGGFSWVYLGKDLNLGDYVAIKGMISGGDGRRRMAEEERTHLVELRQRNIVGIRNFARHDNGEAIGEYIVMDFLQGSTLRALKQARNLQQGAGIPPEQVAVFLLEVLEALQHLHDRGFLYMDLKPDNIMLTAEGVFLIDLGAVRRQGPLLTPMIMTHGYHIPHEEQRDVGFTVRADVFAAGRVLDYLLPERPDEQYDPLRRVMRRAVAGHHDRFPDAAAMAAQLRGVLAEIRSSGKDTTPSTLFAPPLSPLDGDPGRGLGSVPGTDLFRDASMTVSAPPGALTLVRGLPVPLPDGRNPDALVLSRVDAADPLGAIERLGSVDVASAEGHLALCRACLATGRPQEARDHLDRAARLLDERGGVAWQRLWHEALIDLVVGDLAAALDQFGRAWDALPGEVAPRLALGLCSERAGDTATAERHYRALWARDRTISAAAFGLARIRRARDDREGAVAVLDEVPTSSGHHNLACIAAYRILCDWTISDAGAARQQHLDSLGERLKALVLDEGRERGESRRRLTALRHLARLRAGLRLSRAELEDLEDQLQELAKAAATPEEKAALLDLANSRRPLTW
jgi:serine/threonine-protein kinase PknG